ncbi:MAG: hypothetical protein MUF18_08295 [Fimbriiglobus sp.]|nr:hypothetical protein [Fimbriiglobus sp.]
MSTEVKLPSSHRTLDPMLVALLKELKPGDNIKLTQTVRVGAKTWPAEATGTFRGISYLSTGVTVDRVAEDDIVVPTVHFTKPNGELASIALDENTKIVRG